MSNPTTLGQKGLDLIKDFEHCFLEAYLDPIGIPTIGYGHIEGVELGQRLKDEQAACDLLATDMHTKYVPGVVKLIKVTINQNQFDALVSFGYNCGVEELGSSTLLKKLNAGDYAGAADEFLRWNKAGGNVLAGLTRRRQAERALFLDTTGLVPNHGGKATMTVVTSTFLKQQPVQAAQLPPNQKVAIAANTSLHLLAYQQQDDHFKVTLDKDVNNRNTWWVFAKDVKIANAT